MFHFGIITSSMHQNAMNENEEKDLKKKEIKFNII